MKYESFFWTKYKKNVFRLSSTRQAKIKAPIYVLCLCTQVFLGMRDFEGIGNPVRSGYCLCLVYAIFWSFLLGTYLAQYSWRNSVNLVIFCTSLENGRAALYCTTLYKKYTSFYTWLVYCHATHPSWFQHLLSELLPWPGRWSSYGHAKNVP